MKDLSFGTVKKNVRTDFKAFQIKLASPETIQSWSFGEVTKPETINYRSLKPEKDGLFCERIFGPSKNWECNCGKYKGIRYRGVVCDRCGVEITISKVRRERLGHIKLAVPVSHIWFFKSLPSRIGYLLDISPRNLERILYYESYVVIDPGDTELKQGDLIPEDQCSALLAEGKRFEAKMGAEAIRHMLALIDVEELSASLRAQVKLESSVQRKKDKLKRLRVVEAFRHSGNRPEWMIMEVIPVIPPDLRPLVPLEGGRFAISDLNDLYRRVINRNNRLKKLIEIKAPEVILRNEKRMLQEAVDDLFDNGRRSRAIRGEGNRPLKSLSDLLKGKQGRFRQNLLGKRVDYSGRSVIVIGPELRLDQCGLPKSMALELFKPFIIKKLEDRGYVQTVKSAKRLVEREKPEVWDILEEIIQDHPILLNRAPTLHRLGIQAFQPVLVEGKALRIHPLVCQAFNADFDGDQMAVHVPLSFEAQIEAKVLMLSSNNILSPANGLPLATPSQEIVLGIFYLTKERKGVRGDGMIFRGIDEVISAYQTGQVEIHARVKVKGLNKIREEHLDKPEMLADPDNWYDYTTVGRVVFNAKLPESVPFYDYSARELKEEITRRRENFEGRLTRAEEKRIKDDAGRNLHRDYYDKNGLVQLVAGVYQQLGVYQTAQMLDSIKDIGFTYATLGGITISIDDMIIPEEKEKLLEAAQKEVDFYTDRYMRKTITNTERYNRVIDVWTRTTNEMTDMMFAEMERDRDGFNPVYMMAESGARGSRDQIRQLAAMRGLMAKPQKKITGQIGEIIESPITSNLREGLTVLEYFISTHGARKGLADTALKTADAGYLTRRLVDVAQDVIITAEDCGTILGLSVGALKDSEDVIEPLRDRILGRVALEDLVDPISGEVLARAGEEIDAVAAEQAEESGINAVRIRSVLTCEARRGVCGNCYGRNLATGQMVDMGEAVGVMAAQSIGEPGTQLTLRTFHIGGTAARIEAQSRVKAKTPGQVVFDKLQLIDRDGEGRISISRHGSIRLIDEQKRVRASYQVPYGAIVNVKNKAQVEAGDSIFEWDPYSEPILTEKSGLVRYMDIREGVTLAEELDEITGLRQMVIVEHKQKSLNPRIRIVDKQGESLSTHQVPIGAHIMIQDGNQVREGDLLAKIPREISKTRDITGGLPRVAELFEARKPKEAAIITEIDGVVRFGGTTRGLQKIIVVAESGEEREYLIAHGKHLRVRPGDAVRAGDKLSEGPINPHDILRVKGADEVQEYLVNAIQEVYRLQGVRVNDKHIEIIVRQMLQKVTIDEPGDTNFLEGDQVDKMAFREENEKVISMGGEPATSKPLLLGITKASLSTESFLSAASFQETTRVLTEAAVQGKRDELRGLKENVIIGHIIPAGTGVKQFSKLKVVSDLEEEEAATEEPGEEEQNIS